MFPHSQYFPEQSLEIGRTHMPATFRVLRGCRRVVAEESTEVRFCAQAANIAQGGALPKCDIVDTTFHASCAPGPCTATQSALPTS